MATFFGDDDPEARWDRIVNSRRRDFRTPFHLITLYLFFGEGESSRGGLRALTRYNGGLIFFWQDFDIMREEDWLSKPYPLFDAGRRISPGRSLMLLMTRVAFKSESYPPFCSSNPEPVYILYPFGNTNTGGVC
jgi:hypothetical protein